MTGQSRAAVFVRKCLDGVQSPNAAQVLMAASGVFNETVFVRDPPSVSGCQGERVKQVCVLVAGCVFVYESGLQHCKTFINTFLHAWCF